MVKCSYSSTFLTSELDGGEWSALHPGCFTPSTHTILTELPPTMLVSQLLLLLQPPELELGVICFLRPLTPICMQS